MERRVPDYLAPWMRGHHGVIVTNDEFPKSEDYDLVELHNYGAPRDNGVHKYPWVLGVDFEQIHEGFAKVLTWLISHVRDKGILMLELPYPQHRPSEVIELLRRATQEGLWVISSKILQDRFFFVAKLKRPDQYNPLVFYLDNRSEVGDTISMIPLIQRLRHTWKNCVVIAREDKHGLLPEDVEILSTVPAGVDGVLHQCTEHNEYGDYYRRTDDFYHYPIRLAEELAWLKPTDCKRPAVPTVGGELATEAEHALRRCKKNKYVVLAPRTNLEARNWGSDEKFRWRHVAKWIIGNTDLKVVQVGVRPKELDLGMETLANRFINLCGKTTVKELGTVIKNARLLIGCDSAPIHLAMGHQTPAIVLQGPTAGAPLFRYDRVKSISRKDGACMNCFQKTNGGKYIEGTQPPLYTCGKLHPVPCMEGITTTQVLDALREELLGKPKLEPTLSICMMVKNESKIIEEALRGAIAAADEVVLVDTGSEDNTVELATMLGEKVKVFINTTIGFENGKISNFAAARNFAFNKATSKYVMWLDAGDRIEDPKALREEVLSEKVDCLFMPTIFGGSRYLRERVGPRELMKFVDRVHETMPVDGLTTSKLAHGIKHVGTEKVGREPSLERNIRLLARMLEEEPESPGRFRWHYYLARDLKQNGKPEEARMHFVTVCKGNGFWEERAHSAVELARSCMEKKDYRGALYLAYEALRHCDGWRDPYYLAGDAYYWLGEYQKAIPWFQHCLAIPRPSTSLWLWEDIYTWLPQCQLSYCYEALDNNPKAVFWAKEELAVAPPGQHTRIKDRIESLGGHV